MAQPLLSRGVARLCAFAWIAVAAATAASAAVGSPRCLGSRRATLSPPIAVEPYATCVKHYDTVDWQAGDGKQTALYTREGSTTTSRPFSICIEREDAPGYPVFEFGATENPNDTESVAYGFLDDARDVATSFSVHRTPSGERLLLAKYGRAVPCFHFFRIEEGAVLGMAANDDEL